MSVTSEKLIVILRENRGMLLDILTAPVELKGPDLEAMPDMSVVMDESGDVWQKRGGVWCSYETSDHTSTRLARFGPFRILHIGKA